MQDDRKWPWATPQAWPWDWKVETTRLADALRRRKGDLHPKLRMSYLADLSFFRNRIEHILQTPPSAEEIAAVRGMPHGVDRLDMALMAAEGVNVAGVVLLAAGLGRTALVRTMKGETASTNMARTSHQPTRGGKVIELFPFLAPDVRKQRGMIVVHRRMPHTLLAAVPSLEGRPLSTLVSHPLLDGMGITMSKLRITNMEAAMDGDPAYLFITTDIGSEDVRMADAPW